MRAMAAEAEAARNARAKVSLVVMVMVIIIIVVIMKAKKTWQGYFMSECFISTPGDCSGRWAQGKQGFEARCWCHHRKPCRPPAQIPPGTSASYLNTYLPTYLPADPEQHLGGEQQHHRLPCPRRHHGHLHAEHVIQSGPNSCAGINIKTILQMMVWMLWTINLQKLPQPWSIFFKNKIMTSLIFLFSQAPPHLPVSPPGGAVPR